LNDVAVAGKIFFLRRIAGTHLPKEGALGAKCHAFSLASKTNPRLIYYGASNSTKTNQPRKAPKNEEGVENKYNQRGQNKI